MALNWPQRVAIYMGGFIIIGMLLYPPWRVTAYSGVNWRMGYNDRVQVRRRPQRRYSSLFHPPARPLETSKVEPVTERRTGSWADAEIDLPLLLVQCLTVLVATGLAVFAGFELRKRQTGEGT